MSKANTQSGGIGFVGLLQVVFITLKLTDYIDWAWLWVLSPIWISMITMTALIIIFVMLMVISGN